MAYKSKYTGAQIDEGIEKALSASGGALCQHSIEIVGKETFLISFNSSYGKEYIYDTLLKFLEYGTLCVTGYISSDASAIITDIALEEADKILVTYLIMDDTEYYLKIANSIISQSDIVYFKDTVRQL